MVIGIAGGSGSGKTTVVSALVRQLGHDLSVVLAHDRYYRDLSSMAAGARADLNFDHPDALETDLLVAHVRDLRDGRSIDAPVYDFSRHVRGERGERVEPRQVLIVEGVLVLTEEALRNLMDLRVFVDTTEHVRFERRLARDVAERGRTPESVRAQYEATVRPMHMRFVEPSRQYANLIVTEGGFNDLDVRRVLRKIRESLSADRA